MIIRIGDSRDKITGEIGIIRQNIYISNSAGVYFSYTLPSKSQIQLSFNTLRLYLYIFDSLNILYTFFFK